MIANMQQDYLHSLGSKIREVRRKKGKSLTKFCLTTGIDKGVLHRIEAGKNDSRISTLLKVAEALEISLSKLLKGL